MVMLYSRFISQPSKNYINFLNATKVFLDSPDGPALDRLYADARAEDIRQRWMESRKLKKQVSGAQCPIKLRYPNCKPGRAPKGCEFKESCGGHCPPMFTWADHYGLYKGLDNKPALYASQPYQLNSEGLTDLINLCEKYGLSFNVSPYSWYFPTGTIMVEVRLKEHFVEYVYTEK